MKSQTEKGVSVTGVYLNQNWYNVHVMIMSMKQTCLHVLIVTSLSAKNMQETIMTGRITRNISSNNNTVTEFYKIMNTCQLRVIPPLKRTRKVSKGAFDPAETRRNLVFESNPQVLFSNRREYVVTYCDSRSSWLNNFPEMFCCECQEAWNLLMYELYCLLWSFLSCESCIIAFYLMLHFFVWLKCN